jgi:TetR/AcrR family transcriptional repressor of mexJK operon
MGAQAQIITKGRKFEQVLDGARTVFMRDGFERASVDDIAREAGVSKATLYSYFPDKRLLFMEIAKSECRRQADDAEALIDDTAPVIQVLQETAQKIIGFFMTAFGQRIFRIAVSESENFPALGQEFYHSGPVLVRTRLVRYLQSAVERGELLIDDFDLAADQFVQLCKADLHDRVLFGISESPSHTSGQTCCTPTDVDRVVNGAVSMFVARYGAAKPV